MGMSVPFAAVSILIALSESQYGVYRKCLSGLINDLSVPVLLILPVLAAVTTYITQKQVATDPKQAQMMMFMPLLIGWFATRFPAGLALYWVASNIFGIIQHYLAGGQLALKGELAPDENN